MPNFRKKSSQNFLEKCSAIVTLLQLKVWNSLEQFGTEIFFLLKIDIHSAKEGANKKRPQHRSTMYCSFIPAPLRNLSIKHIIVVLY